MDKLKELEEILICPRCKCSVELVEHSKSFKCKGCLYIYPLDEDIPVMLVDSATKDAQ